MIMFVEESSQYVFKDDNKEKSFKGVTWRSEGITTIKMLYKNTGSLEINGNIYGGLSDVKGK